MLKVHQSGDDNPHLEGDGYTVPLTLVSLPPLARQLPPSRDGTSPSPAAGGEDGAPPPSSVLGYNSSDGVVYLLPPADSSRSSAGGHGDASGPDGGGGGADAVSHATALRRYDDAVTALAVSPDGLRVSLGFEDGSTVVCSYDGFDPRRAGRGDGDGIEDGDGGSAAGNDGAPTTTAAVHPFVLCSRDASPTLSQGLSQEVPGEETFDGPRLDAAVRDMAFDPRSGGEGKKRAGYFLAIASESGNQPLTVVDVSSEATSADAYLQERSGDELEGGGARSVAYSPVPPAAADADGGAGERAGNVLLSCAGMTGRLTHWDVTSLSDPELMWDAVHGDLAPSSARDGGLGSGDPASALAAGGAWVTLLPEEEEAVPGEEGRVRAVPRAVLLVPGRSDLQYRATDVASSSGGELTADELKGFLSRARFAPGGHAGDIVCVVARNTSPDGAVALTGGADGRVRRWTVRAGADGKVEVAHDGEVDVPPAPSAGGTRGAPPVTSLVWCGEDGVLVGRGDGSAP